MPRVRFRGIPTGHSEGASLGQGMPSSSGTSEVISSAMMLSKTDSEVSGYLRGSYFRDKSLEHGREHDRRHDIV